MTSSIGYLVDPSSRLSSVLCYVRADVLYVRTMVPYSVLYFILYNVRSVVFYILLGSDVIDSINTLTTKKPFL